MIAIDVDPTVLVQVIGAALAAGILTSVYQARKLKAEAKKTDVEAGQVIVNTAATVVVLAKEQLADIRAENIGLAQKLETAVSEIVGMRDRIEHLEDDGHKIAVERGLLQDENVRLHEQVDRLTNKVTALEAEVSRLSEFS